MASDWKRLHPASLAVNLVPQAGRTLRAAWPILLAIFIGGQQAGAQVFDLAALVVFFLMTASRTFVHWATLRYRVHDERLEIRVGLLHRQARVIDPARIQNVELVRNIFHRWSGLVEVRLETAGGSKETEGLLSALRVADATRLQAELKALAGSPVSEARAGEVLVADGILELAAYGSTHRTVGVGPLILAIGGELAGHLGPAPLGEVLAANPAKLGGLVLLAFAASWALSVGASIVRYFGFRLVRDGNRLVTTAGLITTRRVEIPVSKVQLVGVSEPLFRRLLGFATVEIETAGLGVFDGRVRQAEAMVPMVHHEDLADLLAHAAPVDINPWADRLEPAHSRALWHALGGATLRTAVLTAAGALLLGPWGTLLALTWPGFLFAAWLDWQFQAWLVTPRAIVSRRGFFTRRTWVLSRDKLQSVHAVQGPLLGLLGIAILVVRVAGSTVRLPAMEAGLAERFIDTLSREAGAPGTPQPAPA